jgi:hypothetical protein
VIPHPLLRSLQLRYPYCYSLSSPSFRARRLSARSTNFQNHPSTISPTCSSNGDSGSLFLREFAALFRRAAIKSSINIIYRLHTRYKCVKRSPLIAGRFEKLLKLFVFNFATESQSESSNKTPPLSSRHA